MNNETTKWVLTGYAGVQVSFDDEEEARKAHETELRFAPRATLHKVTTTSQQVAGN